MSEAQNIALKQKNKRIDNEPGQNISNYLQVLLNRKPAEEYLNQWANVLKKQQRTESLSTECSVVLFSLGKEWLALPAQYFKEVTQLKSIHVIPHRSNKFLLGAINLEGELRLAISLHALLGIDTNGQIDQGPYSYKRMIAIEKEGEVWVFPVDDITGIYRCNLAELENVPVTLTKSTANYLKGVVRTGNKNVGLLDSDLLFYGLKRGIL